MSRDWKNQLNIDLFAFKKRWKYEFSKKYCLHPNASEKNCNKIINAHTITKSSGLNTIAEDGHVYSIKPGITHHIDTFKVHIDTFKVGVKKASTFKGFCSRHDSTLFKPIEQEKIELNEKSIFLLSYRVAAHEFYLKEADLRSSKIFYDDGNKGISHDMQISFQNQISKRISSAEVGVRELKILKAKYDAALNSRDFSKFKYVAVRIDKTLPIVTSGGRFPDFDFEGNPLFDKIKNFDDPPMVQINIVNDQIGAVASIAWFNDDIRMNSFADSFLKRVKVQGADFLVQLGIMTCENTFYRVSWWDALNKQTQAALLSATFSDILPNFPSWGKAILKPVDLGLNGTVIKEISSRNK